MGFEFYCDSRHPCGKCHKKLLQQERAKVEEEKLEVIGDLMDSLNATELKIIELEKQKKKVLDEVFETLAPKEFLKGMSDDSKITWTKKGFLEKKKQMEG